MTVTTEQLVTVGAAPLTRDHVAAVARHDARVKIDPGALERVAATRALVEGLADDPETQTDLDEARKLINALAGLITAGAPEISDMHARSLRDGLRSVQLAFREASTIPDLPGKGPGEKFTGSVV